jgi:hypothetical protein
VVRRVQVIVGIWLSVWALSGSVLVHLHVSIRSILSRLCLLRRHNLLLCLLPLSAHAFISLLLLDARCWGSARA